MNKYNESRPFLDKLEAEIAGGMPATKFYQMVLEYLDERDRERNELAAQVERLRGAVVSVRGVIGYGWEDGNGESLDGVVSFVDSVLSETTAQSLEAVKREWKAELIEHCYMFSFLIDDRATEQSVDISVIEDFES